MSWEVQTMQSATSFFNRALFRKNLQRFWPLWFGYTLLWLLILPLTLLNQLVQASWISHASWHIAKAKKMPNTAAIARPP